MPPSRPLNNKPWAVLKVSRRQYETARPWKKAGLSRAAYEAILAELPEGFIDELHLEADAEKLLRSAFGEADIFPCDDGDPMPENG